MRLSELLQALGVEASGVREDVEVDGVAADSRRVGPGDVFFALPGVHTDGRRHIAEALGRGARAVITTGEVDAGGAPVVCVDAPERLLARAAAHLAGDPSAALTLVGVTGTNGKTTTTYLLEAIWRAAGRRPGVVGTITYRFDGASRPGGRAPGGARARAVRAGRGGPARGGAPGRGRARGGGDGRPAGAGRRAPAVREPARGRAAPGKHPGGRGRSLGARDAAGGDRAR